MESLGAVESVALALWSVAFAFTDSTLYQVRLSGGEDVVDVIFCGTPSPESGFADDDRSDTS